MSIDLLLREYSQLTVPPIQDEEKVSEILGNSTLVNWIIHIYLTEVLNSPKKSQALLVLLCDGSNQVASRVRLILCEYLLRLIQALKSQLNHFPAVHRPFLVSHATILRDLNRLANTVSAISKQEAQLEDLDKLLIFLQVNRINRYKLFIKCSELRLKAETVADSAESEAEKLVRDLLTQLSELALQVFTSKSSQHLNAVISEVSFAILSHTLALRHFSSSRVNLTIIFQEQIILCNHILGNIMEVTGQNNNEIFSEFQALLTQISNERQEG